MAKKVGGTAAGYNKAGDKDAQVSVKAAPTIVHFSIAKKTAKNLGRVKRWEDRSSSTSLELTGRN